MTGKKRSLNQNKKPMIDLTQFTVAQNYQHNAKNKKYTSQLRNTSFSPLHLNEGRISYPIKQKLGAERIYCNTVSCQA